MVRRTRGCDVIDFVLHFTIIYSRIRVRSRRLFRFVPIRKLKLMIICKAWDIWVSDLFWQRVIHNTGSRVVRCWFAKAGDKTELFIWSFGEPIGRSKTHGLRILTKFSNNRSRRSSWIKSSSLCMSSRLWPIEAFEHLKQLKASICISNKSQGIGVWHHLSKRVLTPINRSFCFLRLCRVGLYRNIYILSTVIRLDLSWVCVALS